MSGKKNDLGEVMIYRTRDSKTALDVRLHEETVWLNQYQLAKFFGRERSVLTKHIRNIFTEGELKPKAVCAKFAQTGPDGKTYQVDHYNLDLIAQNSLIFARFSLIWHPLMSDTSALQKPSVKGSCNISI